MARSEPRLAMVSARFDGGEAERRMREVHSILQAQGLEVMMVSADAGDDFGRQTARFLGRLLSERGVLLAVCTDHYAEITASNYSSYHELRVAYDNGLDIVPLRMHEVYPPKPSYGKGHKFDKEGEALGLVALALPSGRKFIDCRPLSSAEIAALIAERLRKASAAEVPSASAMPMSAAASSSQAAGGGYTAAGASQVPAAGASKASPGTLAGPSQASPAQQQALQKVTEALASKDVLAVAAALAAAVGSEVLDAPALEGATAFLLAEQGCKNSAGCMPMHQAACQGNTDAVRGLIFANCDKAARDSDSFTPLHVAAGYNRVEIVKLLLEARADKAATNKYGKTALHLAAEKSHVDIARCLLEAGADKDARDRYCFTPLHWAAFNDSVEIVTLLLEARADQEATTDDGRTPLEIALLCKKLAAAAALRAAGARKPS